MCARVILSMVETVYSPILFPRAQAFLHQDYVRALSCRASLSFSPGELLLAELSFRAHFNIAIQ